MHYCARPEDLPFGSDSTLCEILVPSAFTLQPAALLAVAEETGGRTHVVQGMSDIDAVGERIAAQLGKQYSLAYESAGDAFPAWRRIHVEVLSEDGLTALTRSGYLPRQSVTVSDEHP